MLDNTINLSIGADTVSMVRVNQDNYGSTYFGENGDDKVELTVSHTVPTRGKTGESHLVRLNIQHYDADGLYVRTSSAWMVLKTFDGSQDSTSVTEAAAALTGLADATFVARLAARES